MKKNTVLLFILFIFQYCCCTAQTNDKILDKRLSEIYKSSNFPGFAIALIKNDAVVFSKGYGFADKIKKIPYSTETIQAVGSVSKTFIGLALMKAIELGYFTLETNINELLPFKIINPHFLNGQIKVKHLATHTSSLLDNDSTYIKTYCLGNKPTLELGIFLKEYYTPNGKFYSTLNFANNQAGTNYAYSNIGAAVMAYIIEVKSKMPFDSFTKKYIFEPLQMTNTGWFYDEKLHNKYATLYLVNKPEIPLYYTLLNEDNSLKNYCCITYPDGSLKTSVNDLTIYLQAMMKGYYGEDSLLISKASYTALFAKQFVAATMPTNMDLKEPNRAVFWSYSKKGDIRHTGSDVGIFAFISFNPQTKTGKVMTLNTELEGGDNIKTVGYFKQIIEALNQFEDRLN